MDTRINHPADFGCTSLGDDLEYEFECNDNGDNDGDTFIDYPADPQCVAYYDNYELL
ncbi:hypothetical protein J4410_07520 [Candidatus Woesearchaeota archaeon]|nr:hypothetical protein [Candidatus Woesearchaeota archaeon]